MTKKHVHRIPFKEWRTREKVGHVMGRLGLTMLAVAGLVGIVGATVTLYSHDKAAGLALVYALIALGLVWAGWKLAQ